MFDEVERRHGIKEVEVKTLQIEVWMGKDGKVETINESAHLGTKELVQSATNPKVYECIGAYDRPGSKIPVSLKLDSLGTIGTRPVVTGTVHPAVWKDIRFNALKWLDEPEKVAALSDKEKVKLQNIGVVELNDIVLAALVAVPRVWTPLVDAAMAIMQHANGSQEAFPKPIMTVVPDTMEVPDHAEGTSAVLTVDKHHFTVGGKYWRFCSYGICKGRERYAFTWMDVPVSYLDEPK
jgi:hypothetical protein